MTVDHPLVTLRDAFSLSIRSMTFTRTRARAYARYVPIRKTRHEASLMKPGEGES
jgi:hypothetical protein